MDDLCVVFAVIEFSLDFLYVTQLLERLISSLLPVNIVFFRGLCAISPGSSLNGLLFKHDKTSRVGVGVESVRLGNVPSAD